MRHPPSTTYFSVGIERLLVRAALESDFRAQLLEHRDELLASGDLGLTTSEMRLLRSISTAQLAQTVERSTTPQPTRRGFFRAVPATLVAALAGSAAVGYTAGCGSMEPDFQSCDGSRPDMPSCETMVPGGDYWIYLGGKTVFLHLPPSWRPLVSQALCIAFHDAGRSCLSMIDLLRDTADNFRFALAAVEWSGAPAQAIAEADSLTTYAETLETNYCVPTTELVVAGYGSGASVAIAGAITDRNACRKAAAFAGGFPAGWLSLPLDAAGSKVYLSMGEDDPSLPSVQTNLAALTNLDADTHLHTYAGPSTLQASDAEAAWAWLRS